MGVALPKEPQTLPMGPGSSRILFKTKGLRASEAADIEILVFGSMTSQALCAAAVLEKKKYRVRVIDMRWIKPLDTKAIKRALKAKVLITLENGSVCGGVGEEVLKEISALKNRATAKKPLNVPLVATLGLPDAFIAQGKQNELLASLGLDGDGIAKTALKLLRKAAKNN